MPEANDNAWSLTIANQVPARLISRKGRFGPEESTASEEYLILAIRLRQLVNAVFPAPYVEDGNIVYPARWRFPGFGTLVADGISWEGFTGAKPTDPFEVASTIGNASYDDFIRATIDYKTVPFNDEDPDPNDPETFLEVSSQAAGVFINAPVRGAMRFVSTDYEVNNNLRNRHIDVKEPDVPHTVIETQVEWTARWAQIPFDFYQDTLMPRLRKALGKVNDSPMDTIVRAPAETVLFDGFSARQEYTWRSGRTGQSPVVLDLKFIEKNFESEEHEGADTIQVTHQHIFSPEHRGWRRLQIERTAGNFDDLFPSTNLNDIFQEAKNN